MILNFVYILWLGFWRRWFGGLFDNKVLDNRLIQHVAGFVACVGILLYNDLTWWKAVIFAGLFQGLFWARSHGEFYDFGHSCPPDVKRYEKIWWWKYIKKIIPQSMWYGFACDFICMTVRYTLPAIICSLFNSPVFVFAGIAVACTYAFMWLMFDWWGVKKPTERAEWISGLLVGILVTAC